MYFSNYLPYAAVLANVLLLWGAAVITATLIKESISLGLAHSFGGLVHYGGKHGGMQETMVLHPQTATGSRKRH